MNDTVTTSNRQGLLTGKQRLEDFVAEICRRMKGPLSNLERALLHADRQDMRARLAEIERMLAVR